VFFTTCVKKLVGRPRPNFYAMSGWLSADPLGNCHSSTASCWEASQVTHLRPERTSKQSLNPGDFRSPFPAGMLPYLSPRERSYLFDPLLFDRFVKL
jgi:hypothetical protein